MKKNYLKVLLLITTFAITGCKSDNNSKLVSVEGECLKKIAPDKARLVITINNLEKTSEKASEKTQKTYNKLNKIIKNLELKNSELETTSYNVKEEKKWLKNEYQSLGYRARMGLEVTTPEIKRMGEVIQEISKLPNTETSGFDTYISIERNKEEHENCLVEAMKNAKEKAEKMVTAVGGKLKGLYSASENYISAPIRMNRRRGLMMEQSFADAKAPAPKIHTKDETLHIKVNTSFEIK